MPIDPGLLSLGTLTAFSGNILMGLGWRIQRPPQRIVHAPFRLFVTVLVAHGAIVTWQSGSFTPEKRSWPPVQAIQRPAFFAAGETSPESMFFLSGHTSTCCHRTKVKQNLLSPSCIRTGWMASEQKCCLLGIGR